MAAPARTGRNQELIRNIESKFDGCITIKIKGNTLLFGTGRVLFPSVFDLYVIKLRPQTDIMGYSNLYPHPLSRGADINTLFFSTLPMEFPTAFLLHSMEFPTQVKHPPMEFQTLFTSPMEFPTLFTPLPWNFHHFVSIFNSLLGISSAKMPPSMEFSIWKKMPSPHRIFRFLDRGGGGADINWNTPIGCFGFVYVVILYSAGRFD